MQPIPYNFHGKQTYKQIHLLCDKLDKPRISLDFNEIVDENLYLLSQADIVNDSAGNDIELYSGLCVH